MSTSLRSLIAETLVQVCEQGLTLDRALQDARSRTASPAEAAYLQECLYGVLRQFFALSGRLDSYLGKPMRARDLPLRMLLLSGLYELTSLATPPYAVVDRTVQACEDLGRAWAKKLVNAVLRRALREQNTGIPAASSLEVRHNHPDWMIATLQADWPQDWERILTANNARPPLTLRVNQRRIARPDYLMKLALNSLEACPTQYSDAGIRLATALPIAEIPGFIAGEVSVQDEAAQLAAVLVDARPGERILDACAAPGGKTAHLLERTPHIKLVAVDINSQRLDDVRANLERLGLDCAMLACDARTLKQGAAPSEDSFDRILLDAPCSATGVVRRHPDIKVHRRPADVTASAKRQLELLSALWPLLKTGGRLVYSTCSVQRAENDDVLERFLSTHVATNIPIMATWGVPTRHGRQILPGDAEMDGFYYAVLEKKSTDPL